MPVQSVDVRDGDPTIQASGEHRGTVTVTFADGRVRDISVRAPDTEPELKEAACETTQQ